MSERRLLQVFLANDNGEISEVSYSTEKPHLHCTCDCFASESTCLHSAIVAARLSTSGYYPFPRVDEAALDEAMKGDAATFRAFVLEHAVVELI